MQGQKLISDPLVKFLPQRSILPESPHSLEKRVHHELVRSNTPKFESVIIHRIQNGICLEGCIDSLADSIKACRIAKTVKGVNKVLNHLMVKKETCNS